MALENRIVSRRCRFARASSVPPGAVAGGAGEVIEEAKKEGKVVFYTGASANDGNALKAAVKKYPFIKMEYFRAGKDKLLGKYLTEARNNTFLADVYQGSVFPLATLQQRGLWRYRSPSGDSRQFAG